MALITEIVQLPDGRSYPVVIGPEAVAALPGVIDDRLDGPRRVAVITQHGIEVGVGAALENHGIEHRLFEVEQGEKAKRLDVVEDLCRQFVTWGLTRRDLVVAVGGGVVTDIGGFVASVYHRGTPVIHVSTSLLGQIDAAIGGKCGVNLPEGKNLVGSFWQPHGVICDTDALQTLPEREFRAGLGELAKYHFLGGGDLDALPLPERVAACVRIKADVVAADEREGGRRAILNYGHTLGHALESLGTYELRHGEAVAIGVIYAAELAHRLGRIDAARVEEHRRVVETYGLPTTIPAGVDADDVIAMFGRDKKALSGITFVLDGPSGVASVAVDDLGVLRASLEALR